MNENFSEWVLKDVKDEGNVIESPSMGALPIWPTSLGKYDK